MIAIVVALILSADGGVPAPVPAKAVDACEQFNRNRISDEEHLKRYGCPPCPCACVGGELRCAPCVPCEAHLNQADLGPGERVTEKRVRRPLKRDGGR